MEKFGSKDASLAEVQALTFCLLGYGGFLRFDELAKLHICDISIYQDHMELFIESSKMDHLRQGATVVIASSGICLCPVAMLQWYLCTASVKLDKSEQFLFWGIIYSKNGSRLRENGGLSYTMVQETVLERFKAIGLDKQQYGSHSLRAGGASAAANSGVPDRMFKWHGYWRSEMQRMVT